MDQAQWKKLGELFNAAAEMEPQKRAIFLNDACGSDAELRKEIDALLESDDQVGSFIELPVFDPSGKFLEQLKDTPRTLHSLLKAEGLSETVLNPGQLIAGRYQILARLGKGGMG